MRIGAYDLEAEIGRGGMGSVHRAKAPDGRVVAIKLIHAGGPRDVLARFDRERRLLAELGEADGFVPLLDAGDGPRGPYLVMPLVTGGTLADKLHLGPLPLAEAVRIGRELATAMGRAHAKGIIHRDLKPSNVLFTAPDANGVSRPLIADLGLAKHFAPSDAAGSVSVALSRTGEMRGTVGYMAPEQIQSSKQALPATDVFALGAILYECLSGRPTFEGDSAHAVLAKVAMGEFESLAKIRPDAPAWLVRTVERALAFDAGLRPSDGLALAKELEGPLDGAKARSRTFPAVASVAVVAAVVTLGVVVLKRGEPALDSPAPAVAPPPRATPPPSPRPGGAPEWFLALPAADRPSLPLPRGLSFGEKPGEYVNVKDGSVLLHVPAGIFRMGTDPRPEMPDWQRPEEQEFPAHDVRLSPYFIGKLEVSNAQWGRFARETGYVTKAEQGGGGFTDIDVNLDSPLTPLARWSNPFGDERRALPEHPVAQVCWEDARAYCQWAGLKLPSEAQWERAASWDARTGTARFYPWGDDLPGQKPRKVANVCDETFRQVLPPNKKTREVYDRYDDGHPWLAPVGSYPEGATPIGALDMGGNVHEWCEDAYDETFYKRSPGRDPMNAGTSGSVVDRTFRDASFSSRKGMSRCTIRHLGTSIFRRSDLGFRVARVGF